MSIAWGSLVLLIVLLPGVLFFVGTYLPEKFTREAEPRSPLGQLAGVLLIAFAIHGCAYCVLRGVCGGGWPCISIAAVLDTINVDPKVPGAARAVDVMLRTYRWWIFAYVVVACATGVALGAAYGALTAARKIRGLSRHHWVYDLSVDGLTYAYVVTHIRHEERILMYKGFLRAFGLQQDGRFSYIVLTDVTRLYMKLGADTPETSAERVQHLIGASSPDAVVVPSSPSTPRRRRHSLFVIEGEDVANAVFDVLETSASAVPPRELRAMVAEEAAQVGIALSAAELEELGGNG